MISYHPCPTGTDFLSNTHLTFISLIRRKRKDDILPRRIILRLVEASMYVPLVAEKMCVLVVYEKWRISPTIFIDCDNESFLLKEKEWTWGWGHECELLIVMPQKRHIFLHILELLLQSSENSDLWRWNVVRTLIIHGLRQEGVYLFYVAQFHTDDTKEEWYVKVKRCAYWTFERFVSESASSTINDTWTKLCMKWKLFKKRVW